MSITLIPRYIVSVLACVVSAWFSAGYAFTPDTYVSESALSSGRWQKISVSSTGIHFIPAATLRSWGFSSPYKVKVHGYGGKMLPDHLSSDNYIDDLPLLQVHATAEGVYFYAEGVETWTLVNNKHKRYTHTLNPYSTAGYYYVTENDAPQRDIPLAGRPEISDNPARTFTCRLYHEYDKVTLSKSGAMLFGEDFRYNRSHTFNFELPDKVSDNVWAQTSFVTDQTGKGSLSFSVNGSQMSRKVNVASTSSKYYHGSRVVDSCAFPVAGERLAYGISYTPSGVLNAAHLDAIDINYERSIALNKGCVEFDSRVTSVELGNASQGTIVWDITDPVDIKKMNTSLSGTSMRWTNDYTGLRRYVAWNEKASYPSPKSVGSVSNQNLHGISSTPDMVIITARDWVGEAIRLANLHRNSEEALTVEVVVQDDVFNEFSSGTRDPGAFRRFLKMLYDRGKEAGRPLRYALLFGRPVFDNRLLTREAQDIGLSSFIPSWQSMESLSISDSYMSDDIIAMLEDNSGQRLGSSPLSIAVGRVSARTLTQAKTFVDKMYDYYAAGKDASEWKNQVVLMADNANGGVFMTDSEAQYANHISSESGRNMFYNKVYVDAFTLEGGICVNGRKRLHRLLDEGIMWLNYIGHGAITTLADEGLVTRYDMEHMYNKRLPVLFAATCSFSRWDGPDQSGSELMLFNPKGGVVAAIAPTRESLISFNGTMAREIGNVAFSRDESGRLKTIGEIYREAKQRILNNETNGVHKLRYILLGDPAMKLAAPHNRVVLDYIDGKSVTEQDPVTIEARQSVELAGSVIDVNGEKLTDFNGEVLFTMYDAEFSTTSNGLPDSETSGTAVTFDEQNSKLYTGRGKVADGEFSVRVNMPSEVADNYRPAALNMYALAADGREAVGCNRDFYVFGTCEDAAEDNQPPTIDYAYLNHESYTQGASVNASPMFIAKVSDDIGINMSMAGIGHQMTLKLDDNRTYTDVSLYYTPAADGSFSGTIAYPMEDLPAGNHTLIFRVWDTSGNSTYKTLDFFVDPTMAPKLFDIYTDVNPASVEANFYISHNRPDAELTVTLDIYNMLGHRVWTTTVTDRSDMFISAPIRWNLCGQSGARVGRGIYIYRATVKADGQEVQSDAKRIAVTGH